MATAQTATHPLPAGQRLVVTIGVMLAVLLQVLDTTIANVALPQMQGSLSATQDQAGSQKCKSDQNGHQQ